MNVRIRRATPVDVIPTVDISLQVHADVTPYLSTGWMCQYGWSSTLIQGRRNYVTQPMCRTFMLVAYIPSVVFPGEIDVVGYIEAVRPSGGGYKPVDHRKRLNLPQSPESLAEVFEALQKDRAKYRQVDEWRIYEIGVLPNYQRRGIGSLLMNEMLRYIDAANAGVTIAATTPSRAFFEKFGFVFRSTSRFALGRILPDWQVHHMNRRAKPRAWHSGF